MRERRLELTYLSGLKNKSDLLSRLMESKYNFTDKLLKDFCISLILAGRDTSLVSLAWFFWLIHKNPQVEDKIIHELSEIIKHRHFKKEDLNRRTKEDGVFGSCTIRVLKAVPTIAN